MGRSRAIIFLSAIQIILIAQFIDYNFNPTIINNSCLTGIEVMIKLKLRGRLWAKARSSIA